MVTHWEVMTMAMLRVVASLESEEIRYWRMGNLRDVGVGAGGLLLVE